MGVNDHGVCHAFRRFAWRFVAIVGVGEFTVRLPFRPTEVLGWSTGTMLISSKQF